MADIVIINPRFAVSMHGLEHAMPFLGRKAISPAGALALLAAVTPPNHRVTLTDENVEPIDFDRCARANIVGITGMIVQRARMMEIVAELKRRGVANDSCCGISRLASKSPKTLLVKECEQVPEQLPLELNRTSLRGLAWDDVHHFG
jgi:hypothetical protein